MGSKKQRAKAKVEKFLAAPEEVVENPRELAKLVDRKAQDEARLERERRGKLKNRPSLEDILADVVRVAEDETTNPYHEFRSISRRRYELYGHYPIEFVLSHGRFEHIKQMAGLADTVGDRMLLTARTNESLRQHDLRYYNRWIAPHVDKFPDLRRATAKSRLAVFISDTHSLFMDPFTWIAFLAFVEDVQPDCVIWGGDHIDGSEISSHPKVPGHTSPLQVELDCFQAMLAEARETCPRARFVWIPSNHWTDRMVRYLTQVAPALSNLRTLRFDKIIDLNGLEIEIVQGGTFLSPKGQEDDLPRKRMWDRFTATHGSRVGKYHAAMELLEWSDSGVSGHVHKDQVFRGPTGGLRNHVWMSVGGGVIDECAKYYVKGNNPAWSRGFGVIELGSRTIQMTPAVTTHGELIVNGFRYEEKGRLPQGVEAVRAYWTKRFNL